MKLEKLVITSVTVEKVYENIVKVVSPHRRVEAWPRTGYEYGSSISSTSEEIRLERFRKLNGEYIDIGMTEDVRKILGDPFKVIKHRTFELADKTKELEDFKDQVSTISGWLKWRLGLKNDSL